MLLTERDHIADDVAGRVARYDRLQPKGPPSLHTRRQGVVSIVNQSSRYKSQPKPDTGFCTTTPSGF